MNTPGNIARQVDATNLENCRLFMVLCLLKRPQLSCPTISAFRRWRDEIRKSLKRCKNILLPRSSGREVRSHSHFRIDMVPVRLADDFEIERSTDVVVGEPE